MSKGLEIRLSYIPVINFALQQNHVPIIREIILRNTGEEQIDDIDLVVQFKPEFALETDDMEALLANIEYIEVRMNNMPEDKYNSGVFPVTGEDIAELLACIVADCEAGNMSQDWNYYAQRSYEEIKGEMNIYLRIGNNIYLSVWNDAVQTGAWLDDYMIEEGLFY